MVMNRLGFALAALVISIAPLPVRAAAAGTTGLAAVLSAQNWIDGRATAAALEGKVVVLDVFTVDCYNCQNVVPTLRELYAKDRSRGLAVIGIHAPETPAERDRSYVEAALARQGIVWPVAVDNAFTLWNAYGVQAWPTQLIFDRRGRLVRTVVGDSQDALVRTTVESLLGASS